MQWGDSITNATVEAGFGYIGTGAVEELDRFFYHPDHIGSSSIITNAQGIVTECMAYMPFGEILASQKNTNYAVPYLFTSKELDSELKPIPKQQNLLSAKSTKTNKKTKHALS